MPAPTLSSSPLPRSLGAVFAAVAVALAACADRIEPTAATPSARPALASLATAASILPTPSAALAVTPAAVTITQGRGILLGALNADGYTPEQANAPVAWSSSDPAVATVSAAGLVTAVAPGTATITARAGDPQRTGASVVTVAPAPNCAGRPRRTTAAVRPGTPIPRVYQYSMQVFRVRTDDPEPCHRYAFRLMESPLFGTLYQVADNGMPRLDAPIGAGTTISNREGWVAYATVNPQVEAFRYVALDDTGRPLFSGILEIDVIPVNAPPIAVVKTHLGYNNVRVADVNLGASDPNGDALQYCLAELPRDGDLYYQTVESGDRLAVGDCRGSPDWKYRSRTEATFGCGADAPASAYPRTDAFRFYATDGRAVSPTVTNTIAIVYLNTPPAFRGPASVATTEDAPAEFTVDAFDQDGDAIRYVPTAYPKHGSIYLVAGDQTFPIRDLEPFLFTPSSRLRYVPDADFNTATDGDEFRIRLSDSKDARACDAVVRFDVAPVNDAPRIVAPDLMASDGTFGMLSGTFVGDDARPTDVLDLTLRAEGPAARSVEFVDAGGFAVQRVSPTEVRFAGTLAVINTLLARGIQWSPADNGEVEGALVIVVGDRGNFGPGGAKVTTKHIRVEVQRDAVVPLPR